MTRRRGRRASPGPPSAASAACPRRRPARCSAPSPCPGPYPCRYLSAMEAPDTDTAGTGRLRAAVLTREFPPDVYGGAGVHVDFLVRELRELIDVDVHCMGAPREGATAHSEDDPRLAGANSVLRILSADLSMVGALGSPTPPDLVHSHTWYANTAGHLAKLLYGIPQDRKSVV